jgi:hypothetical protein
MGEMRLLRAAPGAGGAGGAAAQPSAKPGATPLLQAIPGVK